MRSSKYRYYEGGRKPNAYLRNEHRVNGVIVAVVVGVPIVALAILAVAFPDGLGRIY